MTGRRTPLSDKPDRAGDAAELRKRAEDIAQRSHALPPEDMAVLSLDETRRALHELRVHQIELEMQNEELRQTEAELDAARARYFDLYDLAPVSYCTINEDGLILEANLTAARTLGVDRGMLVGQSITRWIFSEDQDIYYQHRKRLFEASGRQVCELRMVRPDGTRIWARLEAVAAWDHSGEPAGRVVISDITERKQAEAALDRSQAELRAIYDHALMMICVLDTGGRVVFANPAFTALSGTSAESSRDGHTCGIAGCVSSLNDPRGCGLGAQCDNCELRLALEDTLRTGIGHQNVEYRTALVRDGVRREVALLGSTAIVHLADGAHLLLCLNDITERKALEAELRQAQKMESIGRLAGGVAHDFNNLLTVINGYSKLLLGKLSAGDPMRVNLAEIYKAGERAAGLTRQLLAFSRKQILQPRALDLNRVVDEMRPMLERLLVGEGVEVRVSLNAKWSTVRADPHQLEQVIMNLAVNARDAMPDGGRLLIETADFEDNRSEARQHPDSHAGSYVMLAVTDSGVGMDEGTRQRIFEPFFTTKDVGRGTGLGLSMVQGIVGQSGGYVTVESEPGEGTTFRVYLPAVAEAEVEIEKPASDAASGGKEMVLVVDDQAEVRSYAVAVLKNYGYRVIQAASAGEALLLCERERRQIHLILTDVVMPNMSGFELAKRLEKLRPGIKVLFMSGFAESVIATHGVLAGDAQLIAKPFSPEELTGKVRAVLGPPSRVPRILIADDEDGVRGFLRAALENGGYEVVEAADGLEALREAHAGHVDLVITDLIMPGQDGAETIRALRRDLPAIGIIAISGAFRGQFLETTHMPGADAVLTKPVSAEVLLANVVEVLKLQR